MVFCVDSGCIDHLITKKRFFRELLLFKDPVKIAVTKNDNFIEAFGVVNIYIISNISGKRIECNIQNLYVPNLQKNLLTVRKLDKANISTIFKDSMVKLYRDAELI